MSQANILFLYSFYLLFRISVFRFALLCSVPHLSLSLSLSLSQQNNERHFVQHHYHDHAMDDDDVILDESHHEDDDHHNDGAVIGESSESANTTDDPLQQQKKKRRGGVSISFPMKLHAVLEQIDTDGYSSILSWQPHGRSFKIHKPREFTEYVMPHYFRQSKLTSFQRQLNLVRLSPHHRLFVRFVLPFVLLGIGPATMLGYVLLDWKYATRAVLALHVGFSLSPSLSLSLLPTTVRFQPID
mmetsp:Transcript_46616/g.113581  ORF Transcript_46616/g.113581 Transcript_46616/m.113581 type:complete len:243 (-) Transcript_46616:1246-1974(-)